MEITILVLLCVVIVLLVAIFATIILKNKKNSSQNDWEGLLKKQNQEQTNALKELNDSQKKDILDDLARMSTHINTSLTTIGNANIETLNNNLKTLNTSLGVFKTEQNEKIFNFKQDVLKELSDQKLSAKISNEENKDLIQQKLDAIKDNIDKKLKEIDTNNQKKLDEMREVVDEKMQKTLNERINESFKVINDQLQAVHKDLGEMTNLTTGVNNLNKVMSNVKTRGIWGEIALSNLLEQILTKEQYGEQVEIKGREKVDFAILLPGQKDEQKVILPIDAKFPLADYEALVQASEECDKEKIAVARKNLLKRIKDEAKSISEKYIKIPDTTNFAIMYLPIEGLFAEVVKEPGMLDDLQNKFKIVVSGPTTLTALLNSLQLGFRTLQVQKNSAKVWEALSNIKREFANFAKSLENIQKNANTISTSIEKTTKQSNKMTKLLDKLVDDNAENITIELQGETDE